MHTTARPSQASFLPIGLSSFNQFILADLQADHLTLSSGVIWTALNIDYPGHSFSHLGIFFGQSHPLVKNKQLIISVAEGLNGRLPNQDLLNSFRHISRYTGGVPVLVYDHLDPREHPAQRDELDIIPSWVPSVIRDQDEIRAYAYQAKNIARHVSYQARGRASGVHGLLHQYVP